MKTKDSNLPQNGGMQYDALLCPVLDFGDYGIIEHKKDSYSNEQITYKVIGRLHSNKWVEVPVQTPTIEAVHDEIVNVIRCVRCGFSEIKVLRFRIEDVKIKKEHLGSERLV